MSGCLSVKRIRPESGTRFISPKTIELLHNASDRHPPFWKVEPDYEHIIRTAWPFLENKSWRKWKRSKCLRTSCPIYMSMLLESFLRCSVCFYSLSPAAGFWIDRMPRNIGLRSPKHFDPLVAGRVRESRKSWLCFDFQCVENWKAACLLSTGALYCDFVPPIVRALPHALSVCCMSYFRLSFSPAGYLLFSISLFICRLRITLQLFQTYVIQLLHSYHLLHFLVSVPHLGWRGGCLLFTTVDSGGDQKFKAQMEGNRASHCVQSVISGSSYGVEFDL